MPLKNYRRIECWHAYPSFRSACLTANHWHKRRSSREKAAPPTAENLVGVWIGFDQDGLTFTRLGLNTDSTGYCARVHPADTILHHYGVDLYRVNRWSIEGWNLTFDLSPISSKAEPVYLKGQAGGIATLRLEVGGVKTKWKLSLHLDPESRIEISNEGNQADYCSHTEVS